MSTMEELGITIIPEPQRIIAAEGAVSLREVAVQIPAEADADDRFAADDLARQLREEHGLDAVVGAPGEGADGRTVVELRRRPGKDLRPEGYRLVVGDGRIVVEGNDAAGLYWGTRTLLQCVRPETADVPCLETDDYPVVARRAIHYDTKHHQGTYEYVEQFVSTLSRYKVNMLIWEWEDKLAYERHPEIGAPGAFTKDQMRALTEYAAMRHVQLVPLVQGLGHVSYILKHPQHAHLREIPDSAWEFCPLNPESYDLLFDLWDEAIEATPGSEFLHIGSDETYELGLGEACGCAEKAKEIGTDGLMNLFMERCAAHLESRGRKPIVWYWPSRQDSNKELPRNLVYVDPREDVGLMKQALAEGYEFFSYAPNPGIEPLFLGYFPWVQASMWRDDVRRVKEGCFRDTSQVIADAAGAGVAYGSITTSWDDSGLHSQMWMPRFVCAAEYSWSAPGPDLDCWVERFYREYFGPQVRDMRELFRLMQDGAMFYYDTFGRNVWHWGDVGMIHLPDFPRQELEHHKYWRRRYAQLLHRAAAERQRMARALEILDQNLELPLKNTYDLELYRTCARLMLHNAELVLMLGELEAQITTASEAHFSNRHASLGALERAASMIEAHLEDRASVYEELVETWERTRLPKGLETAEKPFVWAPDRARHLANRTPDMKYLIMDEELLGLEDYRDRLRALIEEYRTRVS